MASLLEKRLLIFSGKGGVGKTTVSAAVALLAAKRHGKHVLVVEIGDQERIPAVFGAKPAGYEGAKVWSDGKEAGEVWSMCLTPRESLHEFVIRQVKFERLYQAVFENRVIRYFTAAAPGLDELVMMGKIENLEAERVEATKKRASGPRFDLIVFDAPATGHGLAFFKVPAMLMRMVRVGPLHTKAKKMEELLQDPERTSFSIVTLPEEMPVNESIDLDEQAGELGLPPGKLVVNGVFPPLFDSADARDLEALRKKAEPDQSVSGRIAEVALENALAEHARRELHEEMISRLAKDLPKRERVELPFLFRPQIGVPELERLAAALEDF